MSISDQQQWESEDDIKVISKCIYEKSICFISNLLNHY